MKYLAANVRIHAHFSEALAKWSAWTRDQKIEKFGVEALDKRSRK